MRILRVMIAAMMCCLAVSAGEAHLLQAGDVLSIKVFNHNELDTSARVQQDGTIRMPLCGDVKAAGRDAGALAKTLSALLVKAKIEEAFVTVFVSTFAPRPVYVLGEVKEGGVQLQISAQGRMTVLQAISAAGGFSETANQAAIGILRLQADGGQERLTFNAADVLNALTGAKDFSLLPGDTVLVPRAKPVSVFGMVTNPGAFFIDTGKQTSCSELLCRAGGLKTDADLSQVLVMRSAANKKPTAQTVDVDAVLNGQLALDVAVQPGDVVVVNSRDQVFVLGQVKTPGAISLDRKVPLTLSKAVAQVGGMTRNANRRSVLVFRDETAIEVNLKAILNLDRDEKDKKLLPGDIVYVQESLW